MAPHLASTLQQLQANEALSLNLQSAKFEDSEFESVCAALVGNGSVRRVNLRASLVDDAMASLLSRSLGSAITTLELCSNNIGDEGAIKLASSLARHPSVEVVCLSANRIGNRGAAALGRCLSTNECIRVLKLNGNRIQNEGAQAIARHLRQNVTVTALELEGNGVSEELAFMLSRLLSPEATRARLARKQMKHQWQAFLMGTHKRAGSQSPVRLLPSDLLPVVCALFVGSVPGTKR